MEKSFRFGDNSFDIFRMVSALQIIVAHCITHLKLTVHPAINAVLNLWTGLFCLFTLTGYLVPASLERSKSNSDYLKKRFLRLYPGLWIAFLVSLTAVLFLGHRYGLHYKIKDLAMWIVAQISVFQFYTPASLVQYGVGNPNGALWTISLEVQIYFVILFSWKWLKKQTTRFWFTFIIGSIAINVGFGYIESFLPTIVSKLINVTFVPYMYVFAIGMFFYKEKEKIIPKLMKYFWCFVGCYLAWLVLDSLVLHVNLGHYSNVVKGTMVSVLTILGGYYCGKKRVQHEISYGLYIYHMIIINIFVMLGLVENNWFMIIVVAISWVVALGSNIFIEKPIMKKFS